MPLTRVKTYGKHRQRCIDIDEKWRAAFPHSTSLTSSGDSTHLTSGSSGQCLPGDSDKENAGRKGVGKGGRNKNKKSKALQTSALFEDLSYSGADEQQPRNRCNKQARKHVKLFDSFEDSQINDDKIICNDELSIVEVSKRQKSANHVSNKSNKAKVTTKNKLSLKNKSKKTDIEKEERKEKNESCVEQDGVSHQTSNSMSFDSMQNSVHDISKRPNHKKKQPSKANSTCYDKSVCIISDIIETKNEDIYSFSEIEKYSLCISDSTPIEVGDIRKETSCDSIAFRSNSLDPRALRSLKSTDNSLGSCDEMLMKEPTSSLHSNSGVVSHVSQTSSSSSNNFVKSGSVHNSRRVKMIAGTSSQSEMKTKLSNISKEIIMMLDMSNVSMMSSVGDHMEISGQQSCNSSLNSSGSEQCGNNVVTACERQCRVTSTPQHGVTMRRRVAGDTSLFRSDDNLSFIQGSPSAESNCSHDDLFLSTKPGSSFGEDADCDRENSHSSPISVYSVQMISKTNSRSRERESSNHSVQTISKSNSKGTEINISKNSVRMTSKSNEGRSSCSRISRDSEKSMDDVGVSTCFASAEDCVPYLTRSRLAQMKCSTYKCSDNSCNHHLQGDANMGDDVDFTTSQNKHLSFNSSSKSSHENCSSKSSGSWSVQDDEEICSGNLSSLEQLSDILCGADLNAGSEECGQTFERLARRIVDMNRKTDPKPVTERLTEEQSVLRKNSSSCVSETVFDSGTSACASTVSSFTSGFPAADGNITSMGSELNLSAILEESEDELKDLERYLRVGRNNDLIDENDIDNNTEGISIITDKLSEQQEQHSESIDSDDSTANDYDNSEDDNSGDIKEEDTSGNVAINSDCPDDSDIKVVVRKVNIDCKNNSREAKSSVFKASISEDDNASSDGINSDHEETDSESSSESERNLEKDNINDNEDISSGAEVLHHKIVMSEQNNINMKSVQCNCDCAINEAGSCKCGNVLEKKNISNDVKNSKLAQKLDKGEAIEPDDCVFIESNLDEADSLEQIFNNSFKTKRLYIKRPSLALAILPGRPSVCRKSRTVVEAGDGSQDHRLTEHGSGMNSKQRLDTGIQRKCNTVEGDDCSQVADRDLIQCASIRYSLQHLDTQVQNDLQNATFHTQVQKDVQGTASSNGTGCHLEMLSLKKSDEEGDDICTPERKIEDAIIEELRKSCKSVKPLLTPTRLPNSGAMPSARQKILMLCNQRAPLAFSKFLTKEMKESCKKIGEGVYGEVFRMTFSKESVAVKIIPIEGKQLINDEIQKTFEEILSEIVISLQLNALRSGSEYHCADFVHVRRVTLLKGKYPEVLLQSWDSYDEEKQSENDRPDLFDKDQLYIALTFENSGTDLEAFRIESARQACSVLRQTACALAVAEAALEFEHRDLHWGNVLIRRCAQNAVRKYRIHQQEFSVQTHGVQITIIDFTMSRLFADGCRVYIDLGTDEALFSGQNEYQFDIYRMMRETNKNDWKAFHPQTNVYWLHYLLRKILENKKYTKTKDDRAASETLRLSDDYILKHKSALDLIRNSVLLSSSG